MEPPEEDSAIDLKGLLKAERKKTEMLLHDKEELIQEKQVLREKIEKEMTENDRLRKLVRMTSEQCNISGSNTYK